MGISGISVWQLLIVLAIVIMLFGSRRIRDLGGDIGGAIRGFRQSLGSDERDEMSGETDRALRCDVGEGK